MEVLHCAHLTFNYQIIGVQDNLSKQSHNKLPISKVIFIFLHTVIELVLVVEHHDHVRVFPFVKRPEKQIADQEYVVELHGGATVRSTQQTKAICVRPGFEFIKIVI